MRKGPMHFRAAWWEPETVCGKSTPRVRSCARLANWDDEKLAGGRRCADCAKVVEVVRKKEEDNVPD